MGPLSRDARSIGHWRPKLPILEVRGKKKPSRIDKSWRHWPEISLMNIYYTTFRGVFMLMMVFISVDSVFTFRFHNEFSVAADGFLGAVFFSFVQFEIGPQRMKRRGSFRW